VLAAARVSRNRTTPIADSLQFDDRFANAAACSINPKDFMTIATAKPIKRPRFSLRLPRTPWGMFFTGFLKHPVMVGSVIPSSDRLIRKMLAPVDWANTKLFVEYGPGVGTFCRPVLDRLGPDATLLVIDTNPDFIDYLKETITDPRFCAVLGSAADVEKVVADAGFKQADYVLSGLPFSTLPKGIGEAIATATHAILRKGGGFLVYQFNRKSRDFMAPHFGRIDHGFEPWNILPCYLFWAWKD
jgi:phospholipid N-methyltransferase